MATTNFIRRLLELRLFLVINLVALFFLSLSFGREYLRNASIESEIASLKAEESALSARNLEIIALSESVQTQYFVEGEGRVKYGLRKPGEELVVVTQTETAQPQATVTDGQSATSSDTGPTESEGEENRVGNPTRWWYFLFDHPAYDQLITDYGNG